MLTLIKPAEVVNTGIVRPAPVTARFDINMISPHISDAEERWILPLLGMQLYEDMISQQNAAVSNYNPDAGALVNKFIAPAPVAYESIWVKYLLRYVAYCVFYEALPFIQMQLSSKGLFLSNSETGENTGIQGVRFIQDNMMQRIENLKPLIVNYLCENRADFPLYDAEKNCPCDTDCSGCDTDCQCGYTAKTGQHCKSCEMKKDSSTNIIFY